MTNHQLIFGLGYSGQAVADLALSQGWQVTATQRRPTAAPVIPFDAASEAVRAATHILATAAPTEHGDPVLAAYASQIAAAPNLRWLGYLSTTGVYGDRQGAWVDEHTPPAPSSARGHRRLAAERQWAMLADRCPVDLFRLAGIYGPGRSAFDDLRAGTARRIIAAGHLFGRIHRDDIAGAVMAAAANPGQGVRVLNGADDLPAASADVIAEAAALLGIEPPQAQRYEDVVLSDMARSFWAENRRVASTLTQQWLDRQWRFPTYREGLRAILAAEAR
jgi:nucleoside-diphosphate-sugar epimerase